MTMYVCSHCHEPVARNDPAKLYSESGRSWFFHNNDTCYPIWKRERLLKEVASLTRVIGDRDYFDMAIESQRLWNGG